MQLAELVATSDALAATRSRKAKVAALRTLLARLAPGEIEAAVHYLSGTLLQGRIGIGAAALTAARQRPPADRPTLTLGEVDERMAGLAAIRGAGSQQRRRNALAALFERATAPEQDFLGRLLFGELRQGAQEGLMLEAIAAAADVEPRALRRAVMLAGGAAAVARDVLSDGAEALTRYRLTLFQPVQPMLAQTAGDVDAALGGGPVSFEYKLDGARIQLHKRGAQVRLYTRRLNDVTAGAPELVEWALGLPADRAILDGEAIVLRDDGRPAAFQTTMRRFGRRRDVDALRRDLPLSAFFFDALHLDGEDLLDRPLSQRIERLAGVLPAGSQVPRCVTGEPDAARAFFAAALEAGHEGLMAKALDAPYEAGQRGAAWRKIKPAHTLDLVVLAAEWGSGRRRGWLSNLHLGARDPSGGFVMLGKTFKGLSDELLAWQTNQLLGLEIRRDAHVVHVRPELVVEIAFDGVQASPQYPAGLALRFARVRAYRSDKTAAQADTIEAVRALHDKG